MATLEFKAVAEAHGSTCKLVPLRDVLTFQISYPANYFNGDHTKRQESIR